MAIGVNVLKIANIVKKGVFSASSPRGVSMFAAGAGLYGAHKATKFANKHISSGGASLGLYKGMYTDNGMRSSGKRGIDSKTGTSGLVQGLHSNRRRY